MLTKELPNVNMGVPSFFRSCCDEARQGGVSSYQRAGYHLTLHLDSQCPYGLEEDEWEKEIDLLVKAIGEDDRAGVWSWYKRLFPKAMSLVPERRKETFVDGIFKCVDNDNLPYNI
jgi:hypothetical protein